MNNDYISRADALAAFEKVEDLYDPEWGNKRYTPDDVEEIINDVPAADVRPVIRSKWAYGVCRYCGFDWSSVSLIADVPRYCPNCGADMRPISQRLNDASVEDDLFPELTVEEKAANKAEAKRMREVDQIANDGKKVDHCADCRWSPPSSSDGKPCCACDPDDPLMNCYEMITPDEISKETGFPTFQQLSEWIEANAEGRLRVLPRKESMTNADKIRVMTDEELAYFLFVNVDCFACKMHAPNCSIDCERQMLEWLKQEVSE